jgi:GT2 family glycosyltransferase
MEEEILQQDMQEKPLRTPLVSIGIVHYQTCQLVKLCLRAIRKLTHIPYEVIVVDNGSRDESLEYLRRLAWIRLIERGKTETSAPLAHAEGLDIAWKNSQGEYFLSLHTDSIPACDGWLEQLLNPMTQDKSIAVVGSSKEEIGRFRNILKNLTDHRTYRWLLRRAALERVPFPRKPSSSYARTFCALYRSEVLKSLGLSFRLEGGMKAGENVFRRCLDAGCKALLLSPEEIGKIVNHVTHATAAINRSIRHRRSQRQVEQALGKAFADPFYNSILTDDSLDL